MRNALKMSALFVLALALAGMGVWAQTTGGAIQGRVVDAKGNPIVGATVQVTGPAVQGMLGTATDLQGKYMIPFVPPGHNYKVKVTAEGYNTVVRSGIDVPLGASVQLPFTMSGGQTEVTVTAAAPVVNLKTTESGATLSTKMIQSIPLSRNADQIAFLAPTAVNSGPSTPGNASIGGSTGAENNYIINGVDVTNTGFGTNAGNQLNFDFIQDMQVLTGGLPPEYGATTGGVINAITRSGGNEFHGSLYTYYWSDSTQAKSDVYPWAPNVFGNAGYKQYDIGGELGGYFVKDKLWFYVAYDYNRYKDYTQVPGGAQYGDQYLYLNGRPAQSVYVGQKITDDNLINPMYAFKLTWNINPNQKLAFTVFGNDRRESLYGNIATLDTVSAPYSIKESPYNVSLQWNSTWSPKFFTDATISYHHRVQDFTVSPAAANNWAYSYYFSSGVYGGYQAYPKDQTIAPQYLGGTTINLGSNYQASYGAGGLGGIPKDTSEQARVKFTNLIGNHELSYGFQYEKNDYTPNINLISGPKNFVSPATGRTAIGGLFIQWAPASFFGFPTGPNGSQYVYMAQDYFTQGQRPSTEKYFAGWVNDNWNITDYFMLKLGLRYNQEKLTGDLTGLSIKLNDEWAPRLGFTWDVAHNGKSKLYGFAGRYYERVPSDIAIRGLNNEVSGDEFFYDPQLTQWTGVSGIYGSSELIQGQTVPGQTTALPVNSKLKGPYTDEYILGFDYQIRPDFKVGVSMHYRALGRTIEDLSFDGANTYIIANPGDWTGVPAPGLNPDFSPNYKQTYFFPKPTRIYKALQLTAVKRFSNNWQLGGSYVLSRLEGNYEGASSNDTTVGQLDPNLNAVYDLPQFLVNGYGLLPLDRTHQLKVYGSYKFNNIPLTLSGNFQLMSGTPISKQIQLAWYGGGAGFYNTRGANGRTPTTWEFDLGAQYNFKLYKSNLGLRLDVFNLFNEQKPTAEYQTWAVQSSAGGPITIDNNLWSKPYAHQAPRLVRLALRWTF